MARHISSIRAVVSGLTSRNLALKEHCCTQQISFCADPLDTESLLTRTALKACTIGGALLCWISVQHLSGKLHVGSRPADPCKCRLR